MRIARNSGLPEPLKKDLFTIIFDNLSKVRLASNFGVDDLVEEAEKLSLEVEALKAWQLQKKGHEMASQGHWDEAHELIASSEKALSGAPSRFAWTSIGLVVEDES